MINNKEPKIDDLIVDTPETSIHKPDDFSNLIKKVYSLSQRVLPIYSKLLKDENLRKQSIDYQNLVNLIHNLHPADLAEILEQVPNPNRIMLWKLANPENEGDVLLETSEPVRESLIDSMSNEELLAVTTTLDSDELAELAPDLPKDIVSQAVESLGDEERKQFTDAQSYTDNQVGKIMDFDYLAINSNLTSKDVIEYLRTFEKLPDHLDKLFVFDKDKFLLGAIGIKNLLSSNPVTKVKDLMTTNIVTFLPTDDTEKVAQAFERYDLITAPVVDKDGRLIGRVTVDEILDVIRFRSEEDMLNMAGIDEEENLFSPVLTSIKNRWKWLAFNLLTAFLASRVIGAFSYSIEKIVALAALMPIVAGVGGNSGNQTITMIVRALATGQVSNNQYFHLLQKELKVALINGIIWGGVMGLFTYILYQNIKLSFIMLLAMTLNLALAAITGVSIPFLMNKLGKDPALGSSILITAFTDSGGFFIFLGLATLFFKL